MLFSVGGNVDHEKRAVGDFETHVKRGKTHAVYSFRIALIRGAGIVFQAIDQSVALFGGNFFKQAFGKIHAEGVSRRFFGKSAGKRNAI